ncbi:MAG: TlpA disulfide reductase family protein [Desulfuromusa sp.]|nr:TlpA disulfide reductase family protein [Desulfuromusa sp.]
MPKLKLLTTALLITILTIPSVVWALKTGDPFPSLSGTTLEGAEFSISSLKGQPIILKVGTTWCPTCGQQSKEIDKLRGFMTENEIQFVDVFIQENEKKVRKYFSGDGHQIPDVVIIDQGEIARALNIYLIPRVILIDKDFQVYRDSDPLPSDVLKQELEKMLIQK